MKKEKNGEKTKKNKMVNKCEKCRVPLEGFGYKLIARPLFGVRSGKKKNICNKCESKIRGKR